MPRLRPTIFPTAARMHAVEVLKGSSQVQYGPFTTGGAINFVSTPVPERFSGKAALSYGNNHTAKLHTYVGNRHRYVGYVAEYLRYQSQGFKQGQHTGERFGFDRNDLVLKAIVHTDRSEGINHSLELKFGYADEHSRETYVGLTQADFERTPYVRYAGSAKDKMTTDHQQYAATYLLTAGRKFKFTAQAYAHRFHRNWYKLDAVRTGDGAGEVVDIAALLSAPDTYTAAMALLTGASDRMGQTLMVKANNRLYHSSGMQFKAEHRARFGEFYLNSEVGLRLHKDSEDLFQWVDAYALRQGEMLLYAPGIPGTDANRITTAHATAAHALAKLSWRKWTADVGVRYEDVRLLAKNYTAADLRRTGHLRQETPNSARAFIPGVGVSYRLNNDATLFAGLHRGFAPPGATLYQEAEQSTNMEVGGRWTTPVWAIELIGFRNKFDHILGSDLAAAGGTGTLSQFSIGRATVQGLEAQFRLQPFPVAWGVRLPLQVSYTLTDTRLDTQFSSSTWGEVLSGDEMPYINRHTLNAQLGVEGRGWHAQVGVHHRSPMRTTPRQGAWAQRYIVPAHTIVDLSADYQLTSLFSLTAAINNLLNTRYIASRHPAGLRPGHPLGITLGVIARW